MATVIASGERRRATGATAIVSCTGVKLSAVASEAVTASRAPALASAVASPTRRRGHARIPSLDGWRYIVAGVAGL